MIKNSIVLLFLFFITDVNAAYKKYTYETQRMGSPFRITISCEDSTGISKAVKQAFQLAAELESQLSDYQTQSELSQVNLLAGKGSFYPIHEPLRAILKECLSAQKLSNGALNVFVGRQVAYWRQARKLQQMPDVSALAEIAKKIQGQCLAFSSDSTQIRLTDSACQLDLGSVGKGFVAQRVLEDLKLMGFPYALVDAGGKLAMTSQGPTDLSWQVAVEMPVSDAHLSDFLALKNVSVATSGKTYQSVRLGNVTYSHVIDPRTGMALTHSRSATAIAKEGALADWLATAATIMTVQEIEELLVKLKDVRLLVFENEAGKTKILFNHKLIPHEASRLQ
jgi:thiamine biosynthesis lipoprotein